MMKAIRKKQPSTGDSDKKTHTIEHKKDQVTPTNSTAHKSFGL